MLMTARCDDPDPRLGFRCQQVRQRKSATEKGSTNSEEVASGHPIAKTAAIVGFAENGQHMHVSWK